MYWFRVFDSTAATRQVSDIFFMISDPPLLLIGQVNTAVFQSKIIALLLVFVVVLYTFYLMCIARTTHLKALQNGIL